MQKTEFIVVIGTVQSYLPKWGERLNFSNGVAEIARKVQCVRGERKLNFSNEITEILVLPVLPSLPVKCPKCMLGGCSKWKPIMAMALPKMGEKKNLWQLSCYKWREKKKKRCYVHNIFHNKLQVVSCYLFKFEPNTKITFLPQ